MAYFPTSSNFPTGHRTAEDILSSALNPSPNNYGNLSTITNSNNNNNSSNTNNNNSSSNGPSFTFDAFVDFLARNHCLETLEFISEAKHYRESYNLSLARFSVSGQGANIESDSYVTREWQHIRDTYIIRGAVREINIPAYIQDPLVDSTSSTVAPNPSQLEAALHHAYKTLTEDALVPFLWSFESARASDSQIQHLHTLPGSFISSGDTAAMSSPREFPVSGESVVPGDKRVSTGQGEAKAKRRKSKRWKGGSQVWNFIIIPVKALREKVRSSRENVADPSEAA